MIEAQLSKTSMVVARSMRFGRFGREGGGSDGVRVFWPGIAGRIVRGSLGTTDLAAVGDRETDWGVVAGGGSPVSGLAIEASAPSEIRCVAVA